MENQESTLTNVTDLSDAENRRQRIAVRAYELYEARGCVDGFDMQDWLQAESEISAEAVEAEKASAAGA